MKNICAWCENFVKDDQECFAVPGKAKNDIDISGYEGQFIELLLIVSNKTIPTFIVPQNSEAKKDGNDFICMTCSEKCADSLKIALQNELYKMN
jgi:hypothetical protein